MKRSMTRLTAHADNVSIYLPGQSIASASRDYHLCFIAGNPGCIGHYKAFLKQLQDKVQGKEREISLTIYGASLPNFTNNDIQHGKHGVLSLREIVEDSRSKVLEYVNAQITANYGQRPMKLILCGHSLGSYIGLEIVETWASESQAGIVSASVQLMGCIGLWSTIVWMGNSPNGRKNRTWINAPLILPSVVLAAECLFKLVPYRAFQSILKRTAGQPDDQVDVLCDLFKSRRGFRQMLYLLRDTDNQINEDRWTANVWGQSSETLKAPQIILYFGKGDDAVDEISRDELIKTRGRSKVDKGGSESWKPLMEVDTEVIPHAFFLEHDDVTSSLAVRYIEMIIG